MKYEHLKLDMSTEAVEHLGNILAAAADHPPPMSDTARGDLKNLENECYARLQHVLAGEPDISQALPGRSDEEGWLNE